MPPEVKAYSVEVICDRLAEARKERDKWTKVVADLSAELRKRVPAGISEAGNYRILNTGAATCAK